MSENPDITIDAQFNPEGFSLTAYDSDGNVLDEGWLTHAEIAERQEDSCSDITFEIGKDEL